jgi:hypothetical protein
VCWMFEDLQQLSRQAGVTAHEDYIFGGAPWVPSRNFQSENPTSNIYWLALPNVLFWELGLSTGWTTRSSIRQRQYFLKNLFYSLDVVFVGGWLECYSWVYLIIARGIFCLFLHLFYFLLCPSFMFSCVLLMQKLDKIGKFTVFIYPLFTKKKNGSQEHWTKPAGHVLSQASGIIIILEG